VFHISPQYVFRLISFLKDRNQVSYSYKSTDKCAIVYMEIAGAAVGVRGQQLLKAVLAHLS
jgi:hypothetical protein